MNPSNNGYYFPAEWHQHRATWLSWPHKEESWPGKINTIYTPYSTFIKTISEGEEVCINIVDDTMQNFATAQLLKVGVDMNRIRFYLNPTNDAWCRDHGPAFLINPNNPVPKMIVDWGYNAWGNKYPPYNLDDVIPTLIGRELNIPVIHPGIVMEGGSVEFNGKGTLLTSTACLLNDNRNPHLNQEQIEQYLSD